MYASCVAELVLMLPRERSRKKLKAARVPSALTVGIGALFAPKLADGIRPPWVIIFCFGLVGLETLALLAVAWYSAVCYTVADEDGIRFGPRWPGRRRSWTWDQISAVRPARPHNRMHVVYLEVDDRRTVALPAPRQWTRRSDQRTRFPEGEQLVEFWERHASRTRIGTLSPAVDRANVLRAGAG